MRLPSLSEGRPEENPWNRITIGDTEIYGPTLQVTCPTERSLDVKPVKGSNKGSLTDNGKINSPVQVVFRCADEAQAADVQALRDRIDPNSPDVVAKALPISHPVTLSAGVSKVIIKKIDLKVEGSWLIYTFDCIEEGFATKTKAKAKSTPKTVDDVNEFYDKEHDRIQSDFDNGRSTLQDYSVDSTENEAARAQDVNNVLTAADHPGAGSNVDNHSL